MAETTSLRTYLAILERLESEGSFDGVTIYPACGIDALVSLFAERVLSINLRAYSAIEMIDQLLPTIGVELAARLEMTASRIEIVSGVDASNWHALAGALSRYSESSTRRSRHGSA